MKFDLVNLKTVASASVLMTAVAMTGCGGSSSSGGSTTTTTTAQSGTADYVAQNTALKGNFSESVTLEAGKTYKIDGAVNFLEGATLTIPAGTTLYGGSGASYLAINRGAKIEANGTATSPIIFTSADDVDPSKTVDQNAQGQWGGLTILGQSTNNKGQQAYEAGDPEINLYGPKNDETVADDNSGTLNYVVIKYSGYEVEKDKELNGLSLGSVGSGTTISNVAIIGSKDDGIEFWGGTVDVKNLYIYNAGDDSIDTDQGYIGELDNVYVKQVVVSDETGSRAIEADSHSKTEAGSPVAKPTLKNATLDTVGRAIRLREGTGYVFDNVQVNVKTSNADSASDGYMEDIAAIRVSETDITGSNIEVADGGLAIKNDAVELTLSDDAAGDIGSDGKIASGKGIYRDADTKTIFDGLTNVKEVVGVSEDMIDGGLRDSDGNAFTTEVSADNTVTGANLSSFEWALQVLNSKPVQILSGDITTDTELSNANIYAIDGEVNVIGATLTIEKGTTLYGATGSSYLAINRGAKIMAEGTEEEPIIFTSADDIAGANTGNEQGQWGGLTILGNSTNNKGEKSYEAGGQKYGPIGENDPVADDNSGVLTYVAIKYSGYEVEKDKELNGLSLGSVGSGTTINNIAIIGSKDDGIELWGGTVSIDGLYIYNAGDDSIDTDQGYVGTLSNVYAEQNFVNDEGDSRVIEADSHSTSSAGDPRATPTLQNAILKAKGRAIRLREGTGYVFNNVQVTVMDTTVDTDIEAIRVSDPTITTSEFITFAGAGIAIKNEANATALFEAGKDEGAHAASIFTGDLVQTDATLDITAYDASWAK